MPLRIDLTAGFRNDRVVIRVDGAEVFRRNDVTTDYSAGLAETVEVDTAAKHGRIEVELPDRAISEASEIDTATPLYLAIELTPSGSVRIHRSREEPRYL